MVRLDLLDENLIVVLDTIMQNQTICKYIYYDVDNPLAESDIADTTVLMRKRIFPFPFDPQISADDQTQLRVYYPEGNLKETAVEDIEVYFDIVVAKESLWLINNGVKSQLRPYRIMAEIVHLFHRRSVDTLGKLHFVNFYHEYVNQKYDCVRLIARMVNFANG